MTDFCRRWGRYYHGKSNYDSGNGLQCRKKPAVCRPVPYFAQDGYRVAPFKSQNMALNSAITAQGLEMGRAQVVQAQAAGVEPTADMNPILLKPTSNMGSQVIVNGVPWEPCVQRNITVSRKI